MHAEPGDAPTTVAEIMSRRPIVVDERTADLRRLMEVGHVRHLPVVEAGRLTGVWIATDEGPLVMLGPERVHQMRATGSGGP